MDEVFAEITQTFAPSGLPNPPVPELLLADLVILKPGVFGTRSDTPGPTQIGWFINEFLAGKTERDYLVFGHEGHGINSYAVGYQLVLGPLALFLNVPFGGVYMQNQAIASDLSLHFVQIESLIKLLGQAEREKRLQAGERFIVIIDQLKAEWRWVHIKSFMGDWTMPWQTDTTSLGVLIEAVLEAHRVLGKK
jgi:hypothetical protein